MNSARYMTGVGANDTLWSNSQGMGEVSLNNYFDIFNAAHILRDEIRSLHGIRSAGYHFWNSERQHEAVSCYTCMG